LLSLNDTTKIIKLNKAKMINKKGNFIKKILLRKEVAKIKIIDLNSTVYLNTAIIENECMRSLNKDILDGPKYLNPLIDSISFKFFRYFFTVPE
tara:strand:+ start:710 stop:991 length:282 start_codon:yes stop_codon:yes gene_type:complete